MPKDKEAEKIQLNILVHPDVKTSLQVYAASKSLSMSEAGEEILIDALSGKTISLPDLRSHHPPQLSQPSGPIQVGKSKHK